MFWKKIDELEYSLKSRIDKNTIKEAKESPNIGKNVWSAELKNILATKVLGPILSPLPLMPEDHLCVPFCVHTEMMECISNRGFFTLKTVHAKDVIPNLEVNNVESLKAIVKKYSTPTPNHEGRFQSEHENVKILREVFTLTITSKTAFKMPKGGRPQLMSNTIENISMGGFADKWDSFKGWPEGFENLRTEKMKQILDRIGTEQHDLVVTTLEKVTIHIIEQHLQIMSASDIEPAVDLSGDMIDSDIESEPEHYADDNVENSDFEIYEDIEDDIVAFGGGTDDYEFTDSISL
jgi:hypothetical protein